MFIKEIALGPGDLDKQLKVVPTEKEAINLSWLDGYLVSNREVPEPVKSTFQTLLGLIHER